MRVLEAAGPLGGAPVYYLEQTTSTMDEARSLAAAGAAPGFVIVAEYQSAGRGRYADRKWTAPKGECLLFTAAVPTGKLAHPLSALPLVSGLAVALALEEEAGCSPTIKWPNDVLVGGRKVAGVLCQQFQNLVLIGVGLNCRQREFPPEIRFKATSVHLETGRDNAPTEYLRPVLTSLALLTEGRLGWKDGVERRLHRRGRQVEFLWGVEGASTLVRGRLVGIDEAGRLLIDDGKGISAFASGELVDPYGSG